MLSFSPEQGLVEHIHIDILWDYGCKLYENKKEKKWWLMKRIGKVAKGESNKKEKTKRKRKEKEKCSLKFYVDGAWNQKKLSIDV